MLGGQMRDYLIICWHSFGHLAFETSLYVCGIVPSVILHGFRTLSHERSCKV